MAAGAAQVMSSGNIRRMADTLAAMRRGLQVRADAGAHRISLPSLL